MNLEKLYKYRKVLDRQKTAGQIIWKKNFEELSILPQ